MTAREAGDKMKGLAQHGVTATFVAGVLLVANHFGWIGPEAERREQARSAEIATIRQDIARLQARQDAQDALLASELRQLREGLQDIRADVRELRDDKRRTSMSWGAR